MNIRKVDRLEFGGVGERLTESWERVRDQALRVIAAAVVIPIKHIPVDVAHTSEISDRNIIERIIRRRP